MDGREEWPRLLTGKLRSEEGQPLEDSYAAALRYGLNNSDITAEKIRLRQKLVDTEEQVFRGGFATEVRLIVEDDRLTVFKVGIYPKLSDIDWFALIVELVAAQNPDKQVRGVFITFVSTPEDRQRCAEHGLDLVDSWDTEVARHSFSRELITSSTRSSLMRVDSS